MAFSSFFKSKSKTPADLVRSTRNLIQSYQPKVAGDEASRTKEEIAKNVQTLRVLLLGDSEAEAAPEAVSMIVFQAVREDFLPLLVSRLKEFDWECRRDVTHIWTAIVGHTEDSYPVALDYLEQHLQMVDDLVLWYKDPEVAINSGAMLRECLQHESIARHVLNSGSMRALFQFLDVPSFDVMTDAFATFKELLRKQKHLASRYLEADYEQFFKLYEGLLQSDNYVTRRQSLKLLGEILLDRENVSIMMRFIGEVHNLRQMMILLKDDSKNIQFEAFHVFKVFVANPNKTDAVRTTLSRNRERLISFLHQFSNDKEDEQFEEEKSVLIRELEHL